eukprot:2725250-Prymnesium_polylepis.1
MTDCTRGPPARRAARSPSRAAPKSERPPCWPRPAAERRAAEGGVRFKGWQWRAACRSRGG